MNRVEHSKIYNTTDGTVSTSLVEDVMSLIRAMANVLHTYLMMTEQTHHCDGTGTTSTNGNENTDNGGGDVTQLSTNERVRIFIAGIQHILQTLYENQQQQQQRQQQRQPTAAATGSSLQQLEVICAMMNDYIVSWFVVDGKRPFEDLV
jgi:hypothetical protein